MFKMNLGNYNFPGEAFFLLGGQFGSEAKGAAAAWLIESGSMEFDAYVCNHGAQAGHTAYVNGKKYVTFHLPTAAVVDYHLARPGQPKTKPIYLSAGAVIDVDMFLREIEDVGIEPHMIFIHPMAAIITDECKAASRAPGSASQARSGVQKGVGQAIAQKVLRTGLVAKDEPRLKKWVLPDADPNFVPGWLKSGFRVLVEIPQGTSLSLNHSGFYPYTTSRDCTIMTAMNDAAIHPNDYGGSMVVMRTFPIRVGSIKDSDGRQLGYSGDVYPDQYETTWESLGVEAEITTVSKRVRRVFTFSKTQLEQTLKLTRPSVIFLSFCNYCTFQQLCDIALAIEKASPVIKVVYQWGPTSADVGELPDALAHTKDYVG